MSTSKSTSKTAKKSDLVIGLKTEVKRQVGLKHYEEECYTTALNHLIYAWIKIGKKHHKTVDLMIWDYIKESNPRYKFMSSDELGIFTTISEYTSAKGKTHLAHFTINNKYLGSVSKLGDSPIAYKGYFLVNPEQFKINHETLQALESSLSFVNIFEPK